MVHQFANGLPVGTGDWGKDNKAGRLYAAEVIEDMRDNENPVRFTRILEEVIVAGRFNGVEIGFFHEFAERAMR